MRELFPGVYRLETEMGQNLLSLHLLLGERCLLIDSGTRSTAGDALDRALTTAGVSSIDYLLVSHADADHHGGNMAVRQRWPSVTILSHELDHPLVASRECHLKARYQDVVAADDVQYDPEVLAWVADMIGPDTRVDIGLRGGESVYLGEGVSCEILHTPGHTQGHLSVWLPVHRALIVQDAVLGRGVPDREGRVPSPPPYYDVDAYVASIEQIQTLHPEYILAAHYPVMCGEEATRFLAESLAFVTEVDAAILGAFRGADDSLTLQHVIDRVDSQLGPFEVRMQWIGPILSHLHHHVAQRRLRVEGREGGRVWQLL